MLAATAGVIGAVVSLPAQLTALVAIPLAEHLLHSNCNYLFPVTTLTEARAVLGTAAVVAVTAVGVIAVGAILRKSAGTVTAGVVAIVVPYIIGVAISGSAEQWLFRLTPRRRLLHPGGPAPLLSGQLPLHHGQRLLPPRPLGRPGRSRNPRADASPKWRQAARHPTAGAGARPASASRLRVSLPTHVSGRSELTTKVASPA